jgi:hypothetical protein
MAMLAEQDLAPGGIDVRTLRIGTEAVALMARRKAGAAGRGARKVGTPPGTFGLGAAHSANPFGPSGPRQTAPMYAAACRPGGDCMALGWHVSSVTNAR